MKLCACGCGTSLQRLRSHAVYASPACRTRAWRQRCEAGQKASQTRRCDERLHQDAQRIVARTILNKPSRTYTREHARPSLAVQTFQVFTAYTAEHQRLNYGGSNVAVSPSSDAPNDAVYAAKNEKTECCDAAKTLARIREAAALDVQNLQTDLLAKSREVARLKRELSEVIDEDSPEAADIKALLKLWHTQVMGADKRVKADLKSTRAPKVRKALKRRGMDLCRRAVLGVHYDDWAMGRVAKSGGKSFNDIAEHILASDATIEKFAKLYDDNAPKPQLELGDEPESVERQFVRHVYGEDCELEYRPASKEPRHDASSGEPPINRVLAALSAAGCDVVAHEARPDSWSAQCPAHEDRSPSLAVHRKPEGTVLLHCFAGCLAEDVLAALALEWRDLWDESGDDFNAANAPFRERVIPAHLQVAMRRLLATDERQAA